MHKHERLANLWIEFVTVGRQHNWVKLNHMSWTTRLRQSHSPICWVYNGSLWLIYVTVICQDKQAIAVEE